MRRLIAVWIGAMLGTVPAAAWGQAAGFSSGSSSSSTIGLPGLPLGRSYSQSVSSTSLSPVYAAPGNYGMAYGTASYGVPRTYSTYSSPYGAGYGYGYAPYGYVPNHFGVGLWRPGLIAPGYIYGSGYYRTFPVPYRPAQVPPVGSYAPAFGPVPPMFGGGL